MLDKLAQRLQRENLSSRRCDHLFPCLHAALRSLDLRDPRNNLKLGIALFLVRPYSIRRGAGFVSPYPLRCRRPL